MQSINRLTPADLCPRGGRLGPGSGSVVCVSQGDPRFTLRESMNRGSDREHKPFQNNKIQSLTLDSTLDSVESRVGTALLPSLELGPDWAKHAPGVVLPLESCLERRRLVCPKKAHNSRMPPRSAASAAIAGTSSSAPVRPVAQRRT